MSDSPRTDSVRADPMRIDVVSIFPEYLDPLRMASVSYTHLTLPTIYSV